MNVRRTTGRLVGATVLVASVVACDAGTPKTPTVPEPPATIAVEGVVLGERPPTSRFSRPPPPLAGAEVLVIAGAAVGERAVSDATGTYQFRLPGGRFKFKWSKAGFQPVESTEWTIVRAGEPLTLLDVLLVTAPWVVTGVITDLAGIRVPGAQVSMQINPTFGFSLTTTSDAEGRYRIASSASHFDTMELTVIADGFEVLSGQRLACCAPPADTVSDARIIRVLRVTIAGPDTLRVGEAVELPISTIDLENGTRQVYLLPRSSDPSVVAVESGQRGWKIRGARPGAAIITCDYRGVPATLPVRVVE